MLEAGDVTTLLEQFETTQARVPQQKKPSFEKALSSVDCDDDVKNCNSRASGLKLHKNIKNSLPKEVVKRIKVTYLKFVLRVTVSKHLF